MSKLWYLALLLVACTPIERPRASAAGEPADTAPIVSAITFSPAPGSYSQAILVTAEANPRIRARWSVSDWEGSLLESGSGWLPRDIHIGKPVDIRIVADMPGVVADEGDVSYEIQFNEPPSRERLGTIAGAVVSHPRFVGSTARVWAEPGGSETSLTLGEQPTWFQLSDLPTGTYRVFAQLEVEGAPLFVSPTYARLRPGRVVAAHIHADVASVKGQIGFPSERPPPGSLRLVAVRLQEEGGFWEEQRLNLPGQASVDYGFSGLRPGEYLLGALAYASGAQIEKRFCCFEVLDPLVPVEAPPWAFGRRMIRGLVRVTPATEQAGIAYVRAVATDDDAEASVIARLFGDGTMLRGAFGLHPLEAAVYDVTVRFDDSPSGPRNDAVEVIRVDLRDGDADAEFVLQR